MKKCLAVWLSVLLLAVVLAVPAAAESQPKPDLTAPAVYVANLDTNIVVYEKNSETPLQSASLVKMMTMLLMLQNYQDQLDTVTVTAPSYIYDVIWEQTTNASNADIRRGETHTLRNLLYAMALQSANEAAYIVADFMGGGSIENFVSRMNSEAAAIGCTGTVFTDPCGLDEGNVTTARDSYLILRALLEYDAFVQATSQSTYDMGTNERYTTPGSYIILTTNKLLTNSNYHRDYCRGGKTGSLGEWQNFAGYHTQDGESYISVVLNAPLTAEDPRPALTETGTVMDWVFSEYTIAPALDTTQPLTELPVVYSTEADTVMLYPADDMMTLLRREGGADLAQEHYNLPQRLTAPIKQGDVVGTVTLTIQDEDTGTTEVVGTADLIAGSTIGRNQVLYTIARVGEFFSSTYFKVVVILTMIAVALYAFWWVLSVLGALDTIAHPKQRKP